MHDDKPDDISKTGISFHWDKDEDLRLMAGGNLYLHPHISTVTYMTGLGSPTLIANSRINPLSGEWMVPGEEGSEEKQVEGLVSWPTQGKHMSFDGRYLHAALPALMQPGEFEKQIHFEDSKDPKEQKLLKRRHRRVTFLVNIWLNYTPFNVEPFPDTMVDKLSGLKVSERKSLEFQPEGSVPTTSISTNRTKVMDLKDNKTIEEKPTEFTWPMGDCDSQERIRMSLPLETIRSQANRGGNVRIHWDTNADSCFSLHKGPLEAKKRSQEDENADESVKRSRKS
ncbi:unnamed protein product [Cylindrotheca closterium]|uniref:Uncharacterized protein n=1 Tax=Cylindrotheca closterium TaxID=2856 RepID=A0AAD2FHZ3_9STRA|nr:unnamed protein product [Cylindrotheca closterium]